MKLANILSGILGLVLTIIAIRWILLPEESANSLGMILLDGSGRNTQIRDFTSIFQLLAQVLLQTLNDINNLRYQSHYI